MLPFPKDFFQAVVGDVLEKHDLDIEFRCIHIHKAFPHRHIWCGSLGDIQERWPEIQDLTEAEYQIYYTPLPRLPHADDGKKEHALPPKPIFSFLWADLDVGEKKPYPNLTAALRRVLKADVVNSEVRPSIIVESGGGLQVYYLLQQPVRLRREELEALLAGLAARLDGDPQVESATHLLRVPNTYNHKYGERRRSRAQCFGSRRTLGQLQKFCALPSSGGGLTVQATPPDYFYLFRPHVEKLTRRGEQATGLCPFHDDHNPSFSLNVQTGQWICFACGREGNWTTFRRQKGLSILEVPGNGKVHADLTWDNLPRFDPAATRKTKWLADGFIAERAISLVYGARGSYKSTFFLALAEAVGKKEEFLGMATRRRKVLYLDYENPPDVIKKRDEDLHLNLPVNKNLVIWDRFGDQAPPRPGDPRLERFVKHCVKELRRKPWIVLDSWSSLLRPGEGGETTGQVAPIYTHLRRLCDLGATVTVLDHTRKYKGDIIYGGQDKEAKADTIHNFVIHENRVKRADPILCVESWLKRYAPQGVGSFAAEVRSFKDENGEWHISGFKLAQDPRLEEKRKKLDVLRELIRRNPGLPQRRLAKLAAASGLGRDAAERLLKAGIGKYWTVSEGAKGKLSYKLLDDE